MKSINKWINRLDARLAIALEKDAAFQKTARGRSLLQLAQRCEYLPHGFLGGVFAFFMGAFPAILHNFTGSAWLNGGQRFLPFIIIGLLSIGLTACYGLWAVSKFAMARDELERRLPR